MAEEVSVLVSESVRHVSGLTGTITELASQSQPPMSPARCLSLTARTVDRLDLESLVQQVFQL